MNRKEISPAVYGGIQLNFLLYLPWNLSPVVNPFYHLPPILQIKPLQKKAFSVSVFLFTREELSIEQHGNSHQISDRKDETSDSEKRGQVSDLMKFQHQRFFFSLPLTKALKMRFHIYKLSLLL